MNQPTRFPFGDVLAIAGLFACIVNGQLASAQTFFIGGYGPGVYSSSLDKDGKMTEPKLLAEQGLPAFFAFHPKLDVLYVVTESSRNDPKFPSMVVSYGVKKSGADAQPTLTRINSQKIDGDASCHVSVDATGKFLAVANYTSGSVSLFRLADDGSVKELATQIQHAGPIGPNQGRQKEAHAHCVVWDPSNQYLLSADLGLDQVFVYKLDRDKGTLTASKYPSLKMAPGSGPRHMSFHPNGKWAYVINELNLTMTAVQWDSSEGRLTELQSISTVPADAKNDGFSTAEVLVHPNGRFVYGSNRGHHTIAGFQIDEKSGKLVSIGHTPTQGKTPRNFRLTPKGDFLLAENQDSNTIFSFWIDMESGKLTATGNSISAPMPACIKFLER
jgi:6-phosphogluconolactonase